MKSMVKTLIVSLFAVAVCVNASAESLLKDTNFSKESGWSIWVEKPMSDAGGSLTLQDGKAIAKSVTVDKQQQTQIQLIKPMEMEADKKYLLKFKANADKTGKLAIAYVLSKSPYTLFASVDLNLVEGEKEYECTLDVKKDKDGKYDSPRSLRFWFGNFKDATITVSDVSLAEIK
jgi:hypothetical protein